MLETQGLTKSFTDTGSPAVADIHLRMSKGESVGIVGESGSGKTTLARLLLGLELPTSGTVTYNGDPIPTEGRAFRHSRRQLQMIPQHASGALNPRLSIRAHFDEVLRAHNLGSGNGLISERLEEVNLDPHYADTFPRRLSGGQQQRVVIARGLLLEPSVLICDEPTSALDALTQEEILTLLATRCITPERLFAVITHDLTVAARLCTRIIVMNHGHVVEDKPAAELLSNPQHPYTQELLHASDLAGVAT